VRQRTARRPDPRPPTFILAAALCGALTAALISLACAPGVVPALAPWFDAMVALPSHVTDTGYPKQREFALVCWIVPCSLAGAALAAWLAAGFGRRLGGTALGRRWLAALEAGLLLAGWAATLALAVRAWPR